ncbi:MAG TPA: serine hydrolase [Alphaproteobacteria bacterium]|nr:serine hydrolase [Alphaproteobacteria bacterium]
MSFSPVRKLGLAAVFGAASLSPAVPSQVDAAPIERVMSTPTAWQYYYGVSAAQLTSVINTGYRVVDLQVESVSGSTPTFTATLVRNSGAYAKGWWWYYGQTIPQVSALLTANKARLISIAPYNVNGTTYYAVVMVNNTGADAKGWYWWVGTGSQINTDVSATKARLVDLEPYSTSGGTRYAAIAINNSGSDADSWWWYLNGSSASVLSHVTTNKAQLLSFNREPGTTNFDVTMQGGSTAPWWFYTGSDAPTLSALLTENGARLTQLRSDFSTGSRRFNSIMINNSNACTTRLIGLMHANGTGWNGNYVKEISGSAVTDGPVPCAAAETRKFEPASAIKVVIATYVMHLVQTGHADLATTVPKLDPNNFCSFQQIGTETLGNAVTQMMQNSDNARTDMLLKRYGMATINAYAHGLGMNSTAFNGYIDCPGKHNTLTLGDAALLYTGLAEHTILTQANVNKLFSMMAGRNYDFAGMWNDLQPIIQAEKPSGMAAAKVNSFIARIKLSYKSGGYTWPGGILDINGQTEYGDVGIDGYASLPVCDGSVKSARQYVFGFFHESTKSTADQTPLFNAMGAGAELLREQVHQALASWNQCS